MESESNNVTTKTSYNDDFKKLMDLSPAATCVKMGENVVYMNPAGLKLFGAEAAGEIIGKSFLLLFHPDHRDSMQEKIKVLTGNSAEIESEERLNRNDGKCVIASVILKKVQFNMKNAMLAVFHDITDFKNTEDELRISQENYRSLLSKLPDYVFIQVDGKIVYVNESMLKSGNYEASDILNRSIFDFIDEKYHRIVIEGINRRLSGPVSKSAKVEIILKSGSRKPVLTNAELIRYENKNALLFVCVDLTPAHKG